MDIARDRALKILYQVFEEGTFSNIALDQGLNDPKLRPIDRAFVTELVYGTIRWVGMIDYIIGAFSSIKLKKISPWIINIIRLGAYQIIFTKVPDSAACNESVKLARKIGQTKSTGFVNAILRNISRNKENLSLPKREADLTKFLSVKYSYPEWLVDRWLKEFGADFTEKLIEAGNADPGITIRVNSLKTTKEKLEKMLHEEGGKVERGLYCEQALRFGKSTSITRLESFKLGLFQVQDESSMLVGSIIDPMQGEIILDVCSAPGGKTTHLAELMENKGKVIARDVHESKLKLIEDSAKRLGIEIIDTEQYDATMLDESLIEKVDRVLVDAPCTGLGIIRKKPDIKWTRREEDIKELSDIQEKVLEVSSKYLKKGGYLVYSTCTIGKEENENIIEGFLKRNENFKPVDFSQNINEELRTDTVKKGYLQLFPNVHKTDGFFIAKLKKLD